MIILRAILTSGLCLTLGACDMGHLGNPLLLPISGAGTAIENANYNSRRRKVEIYVNENHSEIISQISFGGGPKLDYSFGLARVPMKTRAAVTAQLANDMEIYRDNPPALIVAFMVHGK